MKTIEDQQRLYGALQIYSKILGSQIKDNWRRIIRVLEGN